MVNLRNANTRKRTVIWRIVFFTYVFAGVVQAETGFGFNYWPPTPTNVIGSAVLFNTNWPSYKETVKTDLDHMASLGCEVIRLFFWSNDGSWDFSTTPYLNSLHDQQAANLSELLSYLGDRHMKVIIVFGNLRISNNYWQNGYATWTDFIAGSVQWVGDLVDACENSTNSDVVLYYDLQNEIRNRPETGATNFFPYVKEIYDQVSVPQNKRGMSVLRANSDTQALKDYMGSLRPLDFVDFHCYPGGDNENLVSCYNLMASIYSNSTVLVGEFGMHTPDSTGETNQQNFVWQCLTEALSNNIPYALNWLLYDGLNGNPAVHNHGFLYSQNAPKDVLGGVSDVFSLIHNPDMEKGYGITLSNWTAGAASGVTVALTRIRADEDAAGNDFIGRLQVNKATLGGRVWMISDMAPVNPAAGKVFVNAFLRTGAAVMTDVKLTVIQYNSNGQEISRLAAPYYNPPSNWTWNNYLRNTGSWNAQLDSQCTQIKLSISATANPLSDKNSMLDVDAVSIFNQ